MAESILIIGASGRAAAFSALRAGLTPFVIDLFADEDLRAVAEVRKITGRDYPHGFVELAREFPPMPFMFTGGLENCPDVIAQISRERSLIGNGPDVLAKVRDPFALATLEIPYPPVRRFDDPPPTGSWLVKPLRGSGGSGIRFAPSRECPAVFYLQEFIDGESRSAVFRDGELLGVTRQLVGEPWLHAPQFGYCGSIGPLGVSRSEQFEWQRLGDTLVDWAGLQGWFGIDAIVRSGVPWLIEVNPRYTASVEVIELSRPSPLAPLPQSRPSPPSPLPQSRERGELLAPLSRLCGRGDGGEGESSSFAKAIYYAPHTLSVPHNGPWETSLRNVNPFAMPEFADIPRAGSTIERGRPVMTIFGRDETELRSKALELNMIFTRSA